MFILTLFLVVDLLGNRSRNSTLPGSTITEEKAKTLTLVNDTCNLVERTFETALSVRESIFEMEETRIHFREIEKEELANLLSKTKSLGFHLR